MGDYPKQSSFFEKEIKAIAFKTRSTLSLSSCFCKMSLTEKLMRFFIDSPHACQRFFAAHFLPLAADQLVGIVSVFFICVSIVSFCLKTHPDMRVPAIKNITVKTANQGTAWTLDKTQTNAHEFFFYIECICNGWFTFEILVSVSNAVEPRAKGLWLT